MKPAVELYFEDYTRIVGELFGEVALHTCDYDIFDFIDKFMQSKLCENIDICWPFYMHASGFELLRAVPDFFAEDFNGVKSKTPEYLAGSYQWQHFQFQWVGEIYSHLAAYFELTLPEVYKEIPTAEMLKMFPLWMNYEPEDIAFRSGLFSVSKVTKEDLYKFFTD